ncbi:HNH endonuclease [Brachybacterium alimentarium]|uniref:HNH endonuclease n=1 Tax=Brachybacterium alimentarium TaxID=47845 RepID=UPI003FD49306
MSTTKRCTRCREAKPLEEYSRDKLGRYGRKSRCKPCAVASTLAWRAQNTERYREYQAAYQVANADRIRERMTGWRAENPHVRWESDYRSRARKFGFMPVVEHFTRDELTARYGNACAHCGGPFEELDHYPVPVALGGAHSLENCRPSCVPCNRSQGSTVGRARTTTQEVQA